MQFKRTDVSFHKMFSKTLFVILILNFVLDSNGQKSQQFFRKDYSYVAAFKSFYKIHTMALNWTDAKRTCDLERATFWHPENDEEAHGVISFWTRTRPKLEKIYLGLSDLVVEGSFMTVEGKPVNEVFNNWAPYQPDDYMNEQDCAYFYKQTGEMDDGPCDSKESFICKKTLQTLDWNNQCDLPDLNYAYNKENGKCYKLHTTPLIWKDAFSMCQVEQSSLAVINNRLEADYLAKLTQSTPKPRIKESYQRGIYHLGFQSRSNEGWQTVKGTRLNVNPDAWFDNYQPDEDSQEKCGSMFYTGQLINSPCEMRSFFICEHELDNKTSPDDIHDSPNNSEQPFIQPYVGVGTE